MAGTTFVDHHHMHNHHHHHSHHHHEPASTTSEPYVDSSSPQVSPSAANTNRTMRQTSTQQTDVEECAAAAGTKKRPNSVPMHIKVQPMNENGCYEFDRVLKAGDVSKRTRKTKQWKPIHLVLRPHTLSLYADRDGTKLRHQIPLADLTAVARQRDPKKKSRHVFALFTSERNYHIEVASEGEAQDWVQMIRTQARIDEGEDEMLALMSPTVEKEMEGGFFGKIAGVGGGAGGAGPAGGETSASDVETAPLSMRIMKKSRSRQELHSAQQQRKSSVGLSYLSGAEQASYSDFSDTGGGGGATTTYPDSTLSLPGVAASAASAAEKEERARKVDEIYAPSSSSTTQPQQSDRPQPQRSTSAISARALQSATTNQPDNERIVYNAPLYLLKQKHGMRQWKSVWAVLRGKSFALYKNEDEYKPLYVIDFESILDCVDIDNLSKSKRHCFQVITEERQFKFCARGEEEVAKWVGGFKALLAKRRGEGSGKSTVPPPPR